MPKDISVPVLSDYQRQLVCDALHLKHSSVERSIRSSTHPEITTVLKRMLSDIVGVQSLFNGV